METFSAHSFTDLASEGLCCDTVLFTVCSPNCFFEGLSGVKLILVMVCGTLSGNRNLKS